MALINSTATTSEELHTHTSQMSSSAPRSNKLIQSGEYHCTGFYVQATSKYAMAFVATFTNGDDDNDGDSVITASGSDTFGQFTIEGKRSQCHVAFKKHYSRHSVEYEGEITNDPGNKSEGAKLTGKWTIPELDAGEFSFILDRVGSDVQAVESATWRGHYQQWWGSHDTEFQLKVYASGRFEGSGSDVAGSFTLYGLFVDGSTSGPFHFTKQYTTHAITYRGERNGDVLTGEYESEQYGQDTFLMKRVVGDDDEE